MTDEQPADARGLVQPVGPAETAGLAGVLLDPADAEGWADTLRHAGSLLWHLSGEPTAEQLNQQLSEHSAPALVELGADLLVMADQLVEQLTDPPAGHPTTENHGKIHGNEDTQEAAW